MTPDELKTALQSLGCTQDQFARHIQMAAPNISGMIHGRRAISPRLALLVCEWLGPNPVNPPPRREQP